MKRGKLINQRGLRWERKTLGNARIPVLKLYFTSISFFLRLFLTGMLNSGLVIQINHSSTMSCPLTIHVDVFLI